MGARNARWGRSHARRQRTPQYPDLTTLAQLPDLTGLEILMVVLNPATPTVGEAATRDQLAAAGATVTLATLAAAPGLIAGKALYLVGASVNQVAFGATFATQATPGILAELVWVAQGYVDTNPFLGDQDSLVVLDNAHPITSGLPEDIPLMIYMASISSELLYGTGFVAGADELCNTVAGAGQTCLAALETGTVTNIGVTPARRVAMGLTNTFQAQLAPIGQTLWVRSVAWALGLL